MPDTRCSIALRHLCGLGRETDPPRWAWAVVTSEPGAVTAAAGARQGASVVTDIGSWAVVISASQAAASS